MQTRDVQSLSAVDSTSLNSASGKGEKRIMAAAKEFESVMLNQWLQSAESSFGAAPGGEEDEDQGGQQMKSFGVQELAAQLTAHGGIGIASLVQDGLAKTKGHHLEVASTVRSKS